VINCDVTVRNSREHFLLSVSLPQLDIVKPDGACTCCIHTYSVRTSQETDYVSAMKPNRLMLFRETVAVYCENHTEHTDTLCEQISGFFNIKARVTYNNHIVSKCNDM
jgi:hypothetical protein